MQIIKQNVIGIMKRLDFPSDAQTTFVNVLNYISADPVATVWLKRLIEQYEKSEVPCDYNRLLLDMRAMAMALGIHEHTIDLLLFLCLQI